MNQKQRRKHKNKHILLFSFPQASGSTALSSASCSTENYGKPMKNLYFFLLLLASTSFLSAQTYTTVGSPTPLGGTCHCMTVDGESSTSIWEDNNLDLSDFQKQAKDLVWETEIYLGKDDDGGHGIAFVIQGMGNNVHGNGGAPLGYGGSSGIFPSIAIEIDTYGNTFDPTTEDHLAVHLQGNHRSIASGSSFTELPNMEDDLYHDLRVVWHYDRDVPSNSTLTATIDGAYSLTYSIDPAMIFNPFNPIYVGFTSGANSNATNVHKVSFSTSGSTGSCAASLPVEFLSFEASVLSSNEVVLDWATASELNNAYFEVLRSADGQSWVSTQSIDGAGTTSEIQNYQVRDEIPFQGVLYYQLKQIDYNGDFSFSEVLEVEVGLEEALQLVAYPNPAQEDVTLRITSEEINKAVKIQLFHITGTEILTEVLPASSAYTQQLTLNVSGLVSGMYVVKVNNGRQSKTQQIVISH